MSGSFDPIHLGHEWLIREALKLADHVTVLIATNESKKHMFSLTQRLDCVRDVFGSDPRIAVELLERGDTVVNFAKSNDISVIVRGLRNHNDLIYEQNIDSINKRFGHNVLTVCLLCPEHLHDVSSSAIKSLVGLEGWVDVASQMVPEASVRYLNPTPDPVLPGRMKLRPFLNMWRDGMKPVTLIALPDDDIFEIDRTITRFGCAVPTLHRQLEQSSNGDEMISQIIELSDHGPEHTALVCDANFLTLDQLLKLSQHVTLVSL